MAQTKAGRLVFFEDVAQVEGYVLREVKEPTMKAWLLLGCIAVDALKSVSISLNRPAQRSAAALDLAAVESAGPQGPTVF